MARRYQVQVCGEPLVLLRCATAMWLGLGACAVFRCGSLTIGDDCWPGAGMGAGAGAVRTASATAAAVNGVKRADGARSGTPKPATVPSIADVGRAPHDAQDLKIEAAILKAFDVASSRPSDINQTIMAIMHCEHAATQRERRADAVKQRRGV